MADGTALCQEIEEKAKEVEKLRRLLEEKEAQLMQLRCTANNHTAEDNPRRSQLTNKEIARYGRQLILPEIGVQGQLKLCNSSILIVGAGGLGCPVALYLAAAGVGRLGIVDYDSVELSNLHRQVLHTEKKVNIPKAESAKSYLSQLNSSITCIPYCTQLTSANALDIIKQYDIVVDATDNVATRYLLNDACVLSGKPLVSGSALRFEGQLTVYNCDGGACYRCLFPTPPPPEAVGNCSDSGVLGAVPGVIGTLQAVEAIKIACGIKSSYCQKMLLFDALEGRFLAVKLRSRKTDCSVCGDSPTIKELQDYEQFCGSTATDKSKSIKLLDERCRLSVKDYKQLIDQDSPHVLLDVREPVEIDICALPNSLNIPLRKLSSSQQLERLQNVINRVSEKCSEDSSIDVYVICKQGNDSQKAVKWLQEEFDTYLQSALEKEIPVKSNADTKHDSSQETTVPQVKRRAVCFRDIKGGLSAWTKQIDSNFPDY